MVLCFFFSDGSTEKKKLLGELQILFWIFRFVKIEYSPLFGCSLSCKSQRKGMPWYAAVMPMKSQSSGVWQLCGGGHFTAVHSCHISQNPVYYLVGTVALTSQSGLERWSHNTRHRTRLLLKMFTFKVCLPRIQEFLYHSVKDRRNEAKELKMKLFMSFTRCWK